MDGALAPAGGTGTRRPAQGGKRSPAPILLVASITCSDERAFVGRFEWDPSLDEELTEALTARADLIALAAGASKPALDALLAGYYWTASGQIRSLLDSARRVGFLRLQPKVALPFFRAPAESPVEKGGSLRRGTLRLKYETMLEAYKASSSSDLRSFELLSTGVNHFHWGAHASPEGILQLYAGDEPHNVIGPTYIRPFAAFLLKWGLLAHLALLEELHVLRPRDEDWETQFRLIGNEYRRWQDEYNHEFGDHLEAPAVSEVEAGIVEE